MRNRACATIWRRNAPCSSTATALAAVPFQTNRICNSNRQQTHRPARETAASERRLSGAARLPSPRFPARAYLATTEPSSRSWWAPVLAFPASASGRSEGHLRNTYRMRCIFRCSRAYPSGNGLLAINWPYTLYSSACSFDLRTRQGSNLRPSVGGRVPAGGLRLTRGTGQPTRKLNLNRRKG
jgi:hypothetical protein